MLLIPIFQKKKSSEDNSQSSVVRNLFKDQPTATKVCSTSGNRSIHMSHISYILPYFGEEKVLELVEERRWEETFLKMSHQPQRYFLLLLIGQNFFIHMSHIFCCHISETKEFGNLPQSFHGQRSY